MNAKIVGKFSLHDSNNRNGQHLIEFTQQFNLIPGNTFFQKSKNKLWTHRAPNGCLSQIDFILYRKRQQNSVSDCQAFSSSNLIGSDHRMVSAKVRLSVRRPSQTSTKRLYWHYLSMNKTLSNRIDNAISSQFNNLKRTEQTYSSFVTIANKVGSNLLPERERRPPSDSSNAPEVVSARKATLRSSSTSLQTKHKQT